MLELLGKVDASDFEPFMEQFDQLDIDKDGLLTKDDLSAVSSNAQTDGQRRELRRELTKKLEDTNTRHAPALQLMFPTAVLSLSFLWHSYFGYFWLAAGLINGVSIGCILGRRHSREALRDAIISTVLSLICQVLGLVFSIIYCVKPSQYLEMDSMLRNTIASTLTDGGYSSPLNGRSYHNMAGYLDEGAQRWEVIAIFVIYCSFFVYAIGSSIYLIVRCVQLMKDLSPAGSPVSLQKGPAGWA